MEQTAKISILMPVYNAEKYLRAALDSVLNQTLRDIELICVEDGSTDGSPAILEEYAARDARMQVLRHAENQGTLVARKHCMQAVRGQYVMWLDPDDALALDACETVWNEMRRSPVDVLQFGMKVVPFDGADEKAQAAMQQLLEPWPKAVRGDLVRACFVEHKWGWTGCNKAYPAALCKQAAEFLQEAYITLCEDQYIAFVLFSLAKSYRSIEKVLYFYSFGRGLTGNSQQWKRYFTSVCQQAQIYRALERFLDVRGGKAHRPVLAEKCSGPGARRTLCL
jgi:glycosyltransferase involved in cell wall biosynthesis